MKPSLDRDDAFNDAVEQTSTAGVRPPPESPAQLAQSLGECSDAADSGSASEGMAAGPRTPVAALLRRLAAAGGAIRFRDGYVEVKGAPQPLLEELEDREADLVGFFSPTAEATASAHTHRRRLGWDVERFAAFCRRLIGKPGPSTWDEDCRIAVELARIPTPTTTSTCSATPRAEERPLRGGRAIAADIVLANAVSLLSIANRYRAEFGTSMVAALRGITGCDFNERNRTREELTLFAAWMDASTPRSAVGTGASTFPQARNAGEGLP